MKKRFLSLYVFFSIASAALCGRVARGLSRVSLLFSYRHFQRNRLDDIVVPVEVDDAFVEAGFITPSILLNSESLDQDDLLSLY
jgi:hypothetical protein